MCLAALPAIGQAVVGYVGAGAEADATNTVYNQNRVNAVAATNDRYASLNNRTLQQRAESFAHSATALSLLNLKPCCWTLKTISATLCSRSMQSLRGGGDGPR